jgi:protein-tyrosine kinase
MEEGKMSKIYKALEKSQRERESKKDFSSVSELREEKSKDEEIKHDFPEKVCMESTHQLVCFYEPGSLAAEQFRKLRTYLLRPQMLEPPKTIMITSAMNGEGKTFVAGNLAIGIASHFHVHSLVVDCDLRKPQLAKWFGLQESKGLSDYLAGDGEISDFLMKSPIEKLSILPAGRVHENPTELIGTKRMETLVHELKSQYRDRYIILDSTPLLATAEPEVLAKLVDGIIIVIRAGVTPRETVKQAIASLEKEKIIGFVLNDVQFKSAGLSSRYFGSDGYYYHYGYGNVKSNHDNGWRKRFPFKTGR